MACTPQPMRSWAKAHTHGAGVSDRQSRARTTPEWAVHVLLHPWAPSSGHLGSEPGGKEGGALGTTFRLEPTVWSQLRPALRAHCSILWNFPSLLMSPWKRETGPGRSFYTVNIARHPPAPPPPQPPTLPSLQHRAHLRPLSWLPWRLLGSSLGFSGELLLLKIH